MQNKFQLYAKSFTNLYSISKSAVDFESVFEIEKTFEKMTALSKNKTMIQASSLGLNKHKRGRLRYHRTSFSKEI